MDIRTLTPDFSVAPQIQPDDLSQVATQGFKMVINNRPDGEVSDQPDSAAMQAAAEQAGLDYHYLPIVPGHMSETDADKLSELLAAANGPVLAYCRSGTRSSTLWAVAEAANLGVEPILQATSAAGYDLMPLRAMLEARAQK